MLDFEIIHRCTESRARRGLLKFCSYSVETPVFMPVGTEGAIKGLLPSQVKAANIHLILGNTYHLGFHPGPETLLEIGGMHRLYCWDRPLLTDSGGFQMVSLSKLMSISEEGVEFCSPVDGSRMLLTPEESMRLQRAIGADIIMQLDDVVPPNSSHSRLHEAVLRSERWLIRAIDELEGCQNTRRKQTLFPIIQGGVCEDLRSLSIESTLPHQRFGKAIGGLCGGEQKEGFWSTIAFTTSRLAVDSPTYCMGTGYLTDVLLCVSYGVDMFDCVYPTRTARFGNAFSQQGILSLKNSSFECDFRPIDLECSCFTCRTYTRAYLHSVVTHETVGCHLITIHNIHYYAEFMKGIRDSISTGQFDRFVMCYLDRTFGDKIPAWLWEAFIHSGVQLQKALK
jgi:tRNA-guanine transglycosylase